jgi:hypothetical protein
MLHENEQIKSDLDRLTELDEAGLVNLEGRILDAFTALEDIDPTPESVDTMTSLADALDSVRNEMTRRTNLDAELKTKAQEIKDRLGQGKTPKEIDEAAESAPDDVAVEEVVPEEETPMEPAPAYPEDSAIPEGNIPQAEVDMEVATPPGQPNEKVKVGVSQNPGTKETDIDVVEETPGIEVEEEEEKKKKKLAEEGAKSMSSNVPTSELSRNPEELSSSKDEEEDDPSSGEPSKDDETEQELAAEAVENSSEATHTDAPKEGTAMTASSEKPMVPPAGAAPVTTSVPREGIGLAITAGADIPGYGVGQSLKDMRQVSDAFAKRLHTLSNVMGNEGQRYNIASMKFEYPESRQLSRDDSQNIRRIDAVTAPESLVAAATGPVGPTGFPPGVTGPGGGTGATQRGAGSAICAPLETLYEMTICGEDDRPVRDALARFNADRGGVRMYRAPSLDPSNPCTGTWDPKAPKAKSCCPAHCPPVEDVVLEAIYHCMCFSNYTNRFFPEVIKANTDLAMIAHAKMAELSLLYKIAAYSRKIDATVSKFDVSGLGFTRSIVNVILRNAAWLRRTYRLGANAPMRIILPNWLRDATDADLSLEMPGDGGIDRLIGGGESLLERALNSRGINVTWSHEQVTGAGNGDSTSPQSGVAGDGFDTTVAFPLFPEGAFLYLDGGTLDLGVTRDSTNIANNDYCTFTETFENVAFIGCDSLWVNMKVCVSGAAAALVPVTC